MILDPGALGTLLIGLEADRREARSDRRGIARPTPTEPRPGRVRRSLATALHRTADLIAPAPSAATR